MSEIKIDELYRETMKYWTNESQIMQTVEEMSELTKEIVKNVIRHKDNLDAIIEEAADVEITLGQLECCYGITEKVAAYKAEKLKLIAQRLEDWKKKDK